MESRFLLAGHSHMVALGGTFSSADGLPAVVPTKDPRFACLTGSAIRDQAYFDRLKDLAGASKIMLFWMGSQYQASFVLQYDRPFDFLSSRFPELPIDPNAELVPQRLVRDGVDLYGELRALVASLAEASGSRPVICATPPPKGDIDFIRSRLEKEAAYWEQVASARGGEFSKVGIRSQLVMLKIWGVIQDILEEIAAQNGLDYFPVPNEAISSKGFLRREYWDEDLTHANGAYGDLYRDAIVSRYSSSEAGNASI